MTNKEILIQIDSYIKGKLNQEEIDSLWIKFLQQPDYFEWFETELHLRYLIKKNSKKNVRPLSEERAGQPFYKKYSTWMLAAAAAVIISLGVQFLALNEGNHIHQHAISEIDTLELVGADILRSGGGQTGAVDIHINEALANALEGNSNEAIEGFERILTGELTNLQKARVEMNLGILYYNEREFESASAHFETVTGMNTLSKFFEEKAWWFLGNAYLNLNRTAEAREAVHQTYSLDGRFKESAETLLQILNSQLEMNPEGE